MALVPFSVSGAAGRQDLEERLMQVGPYSLLLQQRPRASGNTAHLTDGTPTRAEGPCSSSSSSRTAGQDSGQQQQQQQPDLSRVGLVLWQSGFVLADFLLQRLPTGGGTVCGSRSSVRQAGVGCWVGVRVLELGCGAGTVGMFLALAGAQVVLTDQEHILTLTEDNLRLNFPATCSTDACSSHSPQHSSSGTYGQRAGMCQQRVDGSTGQQQQTAPVAHKQELQFAPATCQQPQSAAAAFAAAFAPQASTNHSSSGSQAGAAAESAAGQQQPERLQELELAGAMFGAGPLVVQYSWGEPLRLLQERVAAGAAARTVGVPAQQVQQLAAQPFDAVVGADLLYDARVHALLLDSLQQLAACSRHLQVFLSWRRRGLGEEAFLQEAAATGWVVEEVPAGLLRPEFQGGDYKVARLVPLP